MPPCPLAFRALALLLGPLGLVACVHDRQKALLFVPDGALAADAEGRPALSRESQRERRLARGGEVLEGVQRPATIPEASRVPGSHEGAASHASSIAPGPSPARPPSAYTGHRALPEGVSIEQALRERFLASETLVEAEKATLYVPPAYAGEAHLSGAAVTEEAPGRRTAVGGAVLRLRRLTVRAARVTLVARSDGLPDVSLSARGRVTFHADLPASVIEERDLKSLLLRNDGYTPLR